MTADDALDIIGIGDQLREEIRSGEFNRYVIFTYGLKPEYLDWFEGSDLLAICGPNETIKTVRNVSTPTTVSTYPRQTHAKIYLLYNSERIVAYLGSFNFTRTGLYESVEWGARYEGEMAVTQPTPEELVMGSVDPEITTEPVIDQILSVVGASMNGGDTEVADSWATNTTYGEGVVHTLRSNTLQQSIADMTRSLDSSIGLTYYTPFVTRAGIEEFTSHLPDWLDAADLHFQVYTKRLERVADDEEMLMPEQIERLDRRFGSFDLRARAPGDQGNELPDGRELRSGMAHFKAIVLSDTEEATNAPIGTILTSANLSERAWNTQSEGFEVGVAVTNTQRTRRLHSFFAESLPQCYVDPSDRELSASGTTGTPQSRGTEEWLNDRLRDRLVIESDQISIEWEDSLPELESVMATVYQRDLTTGDRYEEEVSLTPTSTGFAGNYTSIETHEGRIVDFVRIAASSHHTPPEHVYTVYEIQETRDKLGLEDTDRLPEDWHEFDELIWNNTHRVSTEEGTFGDVETINSVRLRKYSESLQVHYAIFDPKQQPHIDAAMREPLIEERELNPLGSVLRVGLRFHPQISPDIDDLSIQTTGMRRQSIDVIGFRETDEGLDVYLPAKFAERTVVISVKGLVARHIGDSSVEIDLPPTTDGSTFSPTDHFGSGSWEITPHDISPILRESRHPNRPDVFNTNGEDRFTISEEMDIEVRPPKKLQESGPSLGVWWRPSKAFHPSCVQPVTQRIPAQKPRTRVRYKGLVQLSDDGQRVNVPVSEDTYLVTEQPFADSPQFSFEAVPDELDLSATRRSLFLGWMTIRHQELLTPRAKDTVNYVRARLYVDGSPVPRRALPVTSTGGVVCVPLLGSYIGSSRDLVLRLWTIDGPAKTDHYAEAARSLTLSVTQSDENSVVIDIGENQHTVRHSSETSNPSLELVQDSLSRRDTEEVTAAFETEDMFEIQSFDPLRIVPNEMMLLHLTNQ